MTDTNTVIEQFNEAFRLRAHEKLVDIIADDCVMEGVGPAPEGNRGLATTSASLGGKGSSVTRTSVSKSSTSTWTAIAPSSVGGSTPARHPSAG